MSQCLSSRSLTRLSTSQRELTHRNSQFLLSGKTVEKTSKPTAKPKRRKLKEREQTPQWIDKLYYDAAGELIRTETVQSVCPSTCKRTKTTRRIQDPSHTDYLCLRHFCTQLDGFVTSTVQTGPQTQSYFCVLKKGQTLHTIFVDAEVLLMTFLFTGKLGVTVLTRDKKYTAKMYDVCLFCLQDEFQLINLSLVCQVRIQIIEFRT